MNTSKHMIIVKDEIKTREIMSCRYNHEAGKWDVQFNNGKPYQYAYPNVKWLKEPDVLNPDNYHVSREKRDFFDMEAIFVFHGEHRNYWHICFADGSERSYPENDLQIQESCLIGPRSREVFHYLKQISKLSQLRNMDGEKLLAKQYDKIDFVGNDTVLAIYLNPMDKRIKNKVESTPVFPFGCNKSQYRSVKCALENRISVIQGPPGTGKTQTILNIIANLLISGKTVQVVSNNNSATDNVYEKLSDKKYDLGFIAAPLGKVDNKKEFIMSQDGKYPDFSTWIIKESPDQILENIMKASLELGKVFNLQEELAIKKQELSYIELEMRHFDQYLIETSVDIDGIRLRRNVSSNRVMSLWQEAEHRIDQEKKIGTPFKLKSIFHYGISNWEFFKQDMEKIITSFQGLFYRAKHQELRKVISELEGKLSKSGTLAVEEMCNRSLVFFKNLLARRYDNQGVRRVFSEEELWKGSDDFLKEYPVVLSTTFSSRSSLNKDVIYDYVIIDEASQVDVATGAYALSCAKNVVIVGDTKQLPNVITDSVKQQAEVIFKSFDIDKGYSFTNSFLQSILDIVPNVPQTMLREHYRCHPKIVNFCNQKFYNGNLIIMTQDNGEENVLSAIKTSVGNHERNHYNQRQIDVIKKEVLPQLIGSFDEIGIIAPYRNHVQIMEKEIPGFDVATVHKFQGREKDAIVISTVDDEVTDFTDDPYLVNVAVSKARRRLVVVASGNKQPKNGNISDLISYIEYNNFEIRESKLYSVFDYLYKQYTKSRQAFLKTTMIQRI